MTRKPLCCVANKLCDYSARNLIVILRPPIFLSGNHIFTGLVILAISVMGMSTFALPPAQVADRLGIPLNLLLVLVAFKYVEPLTVTSFVSLDKHLLRHWPFNRLLIPALLHFTTILTDIRLAKVFLLCRI